MIRTCAVCTLWIVLWLETFAATAQQRSYSLDQKIVFPSFAIRMDSLNAWIVKKTGVVFSFNSAEIKPYGRIVIPPGVSTLHALLIFLKRVKDIDNSLHGQYIVLHYIRPRPTSAANVPKTANTPNAANVPKTANTANAANAPKTANLPNTTNPPKTANPSKAAANSIDTNSVVDSMVTPKEPVIPDAQVTPDTTAGSAPTRLIPDTGFKQPASGRPSSARRRTRRKSASGGNGLGLFGEVGTGVSDIFYLNPTVHFGLPYLYGTFSWSATAHVSSLRYGAGSSLPLRNGWALGVSGSTGKLMRQYTLSPTDSFRVASILVRGSLTSLSLQVEKKITGNLYIQLGPDFNILKSRYYNDDTLIKPYEIIRTYAPSLTSSLVETHFDKSFISVKAPYLISNTYQANASRNSKAWIGFHIALFFRLNFFVKH